MTGTLEPSRNLHRGLSRILIRLMRINKTMIKDKKEVLAQPIVTAV